MPRPYLLDFRVRDYECDLQGVVNNAVYLHYLEHTRHEFLRASGVDFAALHAEGIDPMVVRIEADYKHALRSGDRFSSKLSLRREGATRILFDQDLIRIPDAKPVLNATVTAVCVRNGRPIRSDFLLRRLV